MARDESGAATPTPEETTAYERAARKRLGEDGCPENRPVKQETQQAQDVPENEQPGLIASMKGM